MPRLLLTRALPAALLAALVFWALQPAPVPVQTGPVLRGPMSVTVANEGRTRVKDRFIVSAPLTGRLRRANLKPGDPVEAGKTLVAVIDPTAPDLLNPRARAETTARVRAAEAAQQQAGAHAEQARIRKEFADTDLDRVQTTARGGAASQSDLAIAQERQRAARESIRAAEFAEQVARFELEQARAALEYVQPQSESSPPSPGFEILSPINGREHRVFEESATVVAPGARLLELADPTQLEVEVDLLTTHAVRVTPGTRVWIEHWGGEQVLEGRVRVVEPSAFTKISALGIEEQRVNVIVDFTSAPVHRATLGDGFRVEARLEVWAAEDVVKAPAGALFRERGQWSVFGLEEGRAKLRAIIPGQRNDTEVEVLNGLSVGEQVLLYPGDQIGDGSRVVVVDSL